MSTPEKLEEVFAYLDANSLLEFHPPTQIEWCAVLGAKRVTLVICQTTYREVSKNKVYGRRKQVARERLAWLVRVIEEGEAVRAGEPVFLVHDARAVQPEAFGPDDLDPTNNDDRIVASALRAHREGQPVCVVTNDGPLRQQARGKGLLVAPIPERFALEPAEQDPDAQEMKQLRKENAQLKNRLPRLAVTFDSGDGLALRALPKPRDTDFYAAGGQALVIKDELEKAITIRERFWRQHSLHAGDSHIARYRQQCAFYVNSAQHELSKLLEEHNENGRYVSIGEIIIRNDGTHEATRVELAVTLPNDILVATFAPSPRRLPPVPVPPEFDGVPFPESSSPPATLETRHHGAPRLGGNAVAGWLWDPGEARLFVGDIRQKTLVRAVELFLMLPRYEAREIDLGITLLVPELNDPVTTKLHVSITLGEDEAPFEPLPAIVRT